MNGTGVEWAAVDAEVVAPECDVVEGEAEADVVASEATKGGDALRAVLTGLLTNGGAWTRPGGVVAFVLSLIDARGGEAAVRSDMDDPQGALTGEHGHAGQELLNLLLTGRATSQVHDGVMSVGGGLSLRGVERRPRVGFLSLLEALRYMRVGDFLKNPGLPVWVVGSESHFTVVYAPDRNADKKTPAQRLRERARRAFAGKDEHENGFVAMGDVPHVLRALGFSAAPGCDADKAFGDFAAKCDAQGMGVALWSDFWRAVRPKLKRGDLVLHPDPVAPPPSSAPVSASSATATAAPLVPATQWSCGMCTFLNPPNAAKCNMCETARPTPPPSAVAPAAPTSSPQKRSGPWTCGACTYAGNAASDAVCSICGTRPPAPPHQPTPAVTPAAKATATPATTATTSATTAPPSASPPELRMHRIPL